MQVESTAIRAISYDRRSQQLRVVFQSGAEYAYDQVPEEVHRDFLAAESKGNFFAHEIRDRYPYRRLLH